MWNSLAARLKIRDFRRQEDGSASIEALIMAPAMFWVFMAMFSFFHTYQEYSVNQKTAYTISDMISRETLPLDSDYLDGLQDILGYLTHSTGEPAIRVTSLQYNETEKRFYVHWSRARGFVSPVLDEDVVNWTSRVPVLSDGEYIVITETFSRFDPPFKVGLLRQDIDNFVFTRPRYAPRVLYDGSV